MVKYEVHAGVARITIDDGKVNVMSLELLRLLRDAFDRAEGDGALVVLRSGRPGIFSAGLAVCTEAICAEVMGHLSG